MLVCAEAGLNLFERAGPIRPLPQPHRSCRLLLSEQFGKLRKRNHVVDARRLVPVRQLRQCLRWLHQLERSQEVVVNLHPHDAEKPSPFVWTDLTCGACWSALSPSWRN